MTSQMKKSEIFISLKSRNVSFAWIVFELCMHIAHTSNRLHRDQNIFLKGQKNVYIVLVKNCAIWWNWFGKIYFTSSINQINRPKIEISQKWPFSGSFISQWDSHLFDVAIKLTTPETIEIVNCWNTKMIYIYMCISLYFLIWNFNNFIQYEIE